MENKNNASALSAFEAMDKAADNFFDAINDMLAAADRIEKERKVFVVTRTAHYKGEFPQGVKIVETLEFEGLKSEGFEIDKPYYRGKFVGNHGRDYKTIREMTCGTILKPAKGVYIQRIK